MQRFRVVHINNNLRLARTYARLFVRGHYLFREANSFPESVATSFEHIFGGYRAYFPSNILRNARGFENWGISLGYPLVLAGAYSVT